ncbi:MAG: hypothetical protein ACQETE_02465 [Bacteroidota bacterium]
MSYSTYIERLLVLLLFVALLPKINLQAQTCSCAGAPLIGTQSLGTTAAGQLTTGLTYQYNDISSIFIGSEKINNQTIRRHTQTLLLEANYGITDRFSISGTFTYIQKFRETGLQTPNVSESLTTRGIGDGLVLLKYVIHPYTLWTPFEIAVGGGAKLPIGSFSLSNNGLPLNADMQPGTGAWDGVIWTYLAKTFPAQSITLFTNNTYRYTGSAERFNTDDLFEFGNELVLRLGISGPIPFGDRLSYTVISQYRSTSSDLRNNAPLPTTGGQWLSIKPQLHISLTDRIQLRIAGKKPIYQHLNGIQPSTTFTLSGSLFYNFSDTPANPSGFIKADR